jgi:hypothetical protein
MPHSNGGQGSPFAVGHTFSQAYSYVGPTGARFTSTTGEHMTATQGVTSDGVTPTIVLTGATGTRHGNVCHACWGFTLNCSGTRIGHAVSPLDASIP